jgi:DNA-binding transcriptional MocR family regulator
VAGEFLHPDRSGKNTMRLNFSFMSEEKMREGIALFATVILNSLCPPELPCHPERSEGSVI